MTIKKEELLWALKIKADTGGDQLLGPIAWLTQPDAQGLGVVVFNTLKEAVHGKRCCLYYGLRPGPTPVRVRVTVETVK